MQFSTVLFCNNPMLREGLKHILSGTRFNICLEEPFGHDRHLHLAETSPALFIVDASHDHSKLLETVQNLKEHYPSGKIVVLANQFDLDHMRAILAAGADGYCLATLECAALIKSLELVMLGEVIFPSALFLSAIAKMSRRLEPPILEQVRAFPTLPQSDRKTRTLSSREAEILRCLMHGAPNKVIARELDVAEATVKVHVKAILRKIQVSNRTQAAIWAAEHFAPPPAKDEFAVQTRS